MRIEAGTFQMGAPARRAGRSGNSSLHTVHISQPFYLGKYEVTQGQWRAVLGDNPSHFTDCGDTCPVENVSWGGCAGLHTGVEPAGGRAGVSTPDGSGVGVRDAGGDADGVQFWEQAEPLGAVWLVQEQRREHSPSGGQQASERMGLI